MKRGLILFAHGARDARWAEPFAAVAAHLKVLDPTLEVRLAFLEFMSPDLGAAGHELASAGCRHVTVLPMFLGGGGHVRKDLPILLETMRAALPAITFEMTSAIGEDEAVLHAMALAALRLTPSGAAA